MRRNVLTRFLLIIITLALSLTGCSLSLLKDDDDDESGRSSRKRISQKSASGLEDDDTRNEDIYENLVINGLRVGKEDYFVETHKGSAYIFLSAEVVTFPFLLPYSTNAYPELSTDNGQISMTWMNNNEVILKIDMTEGSKEAYINDSIDSIDIGSAPKTVDNKLFIPINLFVQALKMEETYDPSLNVTHLHYKEDFPKDLLEGSWSDTDTDLFTVFEDFPSGLKGLSSFATRYEFNENGTYRLVMIAVGGFEDIFIHQTGKYKILGNTIIYYNIRETLYEGTPFKLTHKNKKLQKPSFDFIDDYDPHQNRIKIGSFWLNRINGSN